MNKTCPTCYSCGMPLKTHEDHALSDIHQKYCSHCTDAQGKLKSFAEILSGTADYLVHSQGLNNEAAVGMAKEMLFQMPHWKNQHESHSQQ